MMEPLQGSQYLSSLLVRGRCPRTPDMEPRWGSSHQFIDTTDFSDVIPKGHISKVKHSHDKAERIYQALKGRTRDPADP